MLVLVVVLVPALAQEPQRRARALLFRTTVQPVAEARRKSRACIMTMMMMPQQPLKPRVPHIHRLLQTLLARERELA